MTIKKTTALFSACQRTCSLSSRGCFTAHGGHDGLVLSLSISIVRFFVKIIQLSWRIIKVECAADFHYRYGVIELTSHNLRVPPHIGTIPVRRIRLPPPKLESRRGAEENWRHVRDGQRRSPLSRVYFRQVGLAEPRKTHSSATQCLVFSVLYLMRIPRARIPIPIEIL